MNGQQRIEILHRHARLNRNRQVVRLVDTHTTEARGLYDHKITGGRTAPRLHGAAATRDHRHTGGVGSRHHMGQFLDAAWGDHQDRNAALDSIGRVVRQIVNQVRRADNGGDLGGKRVHVIS